MEREIREQPELLARLAMRTEPGELAAAVLARRPAVIQFVARGTSGHVAVYAKYLIEATSGIPVSIVTPSTVTLHGGAPWREDGVVIAISQSGESPDLVACVRSARETGAFTVTLTNSPDSTLARAAELVLGFGAGPEVAVAATKSYVTSALLVAQLAAALVGQSWDFDRLAAAADRLVADRPGIVAGLVALESARAVVVLGRGYTFANAREAALKIMETCSLPALGFSSAEFLHGPIAVLGPDVVTLVLPDGGEDAASRAAALDRLRARGGTVLEWQPSPIDSRLAPIVDVIPMQLLALEHSRRIGLDADRPESLAKATATL